MNEPNEADALRLAAFFTALRGELQLSGDTLKSFFQQFEADYRTARKHRAATTPHLDVLKVFGLEFAELRHSDVLAWFLKPAAEHEQGPLFLNALLEHFGAEPTSGKVCTVVRERHGRTDVAAHAHGDFALFIENKVRHSERPRQVEDMVETLVGFAQAHGIPRHRRFAVFLTDSGRPPESGPVSDSADFRVGENLKTLRRVELFELFQQTLDAQGSGARSPLLMNLLESYLSAIRRLRAQLS